MTRVRYVELWVCYMSGGFFVGYFKNCSEAQKYYDENKGEFYDYRGKCYALPVFEEGEYEIDEE